MLWNMNRTWSPWQELQRIQSDMSRLFQGLPNERSTEDPKINVWAGENSLKLVAELPGLEASDIDIAVVADTVTIKGERKDVTPEESEVHRRERRLGKFARSFQLPFEIEAAEVTAHFEHGVLTVELPRAHAQRPHSITVKSA